AERMRAIGHGRKSDVTPAQALEAAAATSPAEPLTSDPDDPTGLKPGDGAVVMADDYGRDPIAGTIAALTPERVTLAREEPKVGRLNVHFPRAGYIVARA